MGWIHDYDSYLGRVHSEGWAVGYVPRDWTAVPTVTDLRGGWPVAELDARLARDGLCRELGSHAIDHAVAVKGVLLVGAACDCGWRSPRRELGTPVEWVPSRVEGSEVLTGQLEARWRAHLEAELGRAHAVARR